VIFLVGFLILVLLLVLEKRRFIRDIEG